MRFDREKACPRLQNGRSVVKVEPPNQPHLLFIGPDRRFHGYP